MTMIRAVNANPGGRVDLTFGPGGFTVRRESFLDATERRLSWCYSTRKVLVAVAVLIIGGLLYAQLGIPVMEDCGLSDRQIALAGLPLGALVAYLLFGLLLAVLGEIVGWIVLGVMVLTLPLLLIPGYRRWLGSLRRRGKAKGAFIAVQQIAGLREQPYAGERAVTVWLAGGAVVEYRARGADGDRLAGGFRALAPHRHAG
ncbi:hypothetical protein [Actinomadura atramentaria]|uniref:hypothetical protein n=1 Tax=Actinomadura atramentaria TaxID=1990 RepID=UPI00035ED83E|nr:hypothetical protein [Actinomadura atramentaria]